MKTFKSAKNYLTSQQRELTNAILILAAMEIDDLTRARYRMFVEGSLLEHSALRVKDKPIPCLVAYDVLYRWFFEDTDGLKAYLENLGWQGFHMKSDVDMVHISEKLKESKLAYSKIVGSGLFSDEDFRNLISIIER